MLNLINGSAHSLEYDPRVFVRAWACFYGTNMNYTLFLPQNELIRVRNDVQ